MRTDEDGFNKMRRMQWRCLRHRSNLPSLWAQYATPIYKEQFWKDLGCSLHNHGVRNTYGSYDLVASMIGN